MSQALWIALGQAAPELFATPDSTGASGPEWLEDAQRILAVVMLSLPGSHAAETAGISGVVVSTGDQTPLAGVKVHAVDPATGEIFSSAPTGDDGGFALDSLPASTYEFAVESSGGLYVVATPLALEPGQLLPQAHELALHLLGVHGAGGGAAPGGLTLVAPAG